MTVIPRIALKVLAVSIAALTQEPFPVVLAAESPVEKWEPGHATTSKLPGEVQADDTHDTSDGVYGRFQGDVDVGVHAGTELEDGGARVLVNASAHYYWTAGLYGSYREAVGSARDDLDVQRLGSLGIDVRPLFIPRWSLDWQSGPATLDLLIDSLSISGGAFFAKTPASTREGRRGFELGLGLGLPLAGSADGPWLGLRYDLRWPEAGDRTDSIWLMLSWHFLVATPLSSTTGDVW